MMYWSVRLPNRAWAGAPAALLQGLADGRQADLGGDFDVVGDREPLEAGGLQHAQRLRVGDGEDRRGRAPQREQLTRQAMGLNRLRT